LNSFGQTFRVSIWGESHGPAVGVLLDGVPAGLSITPEQFYTDLERRRGGTQRGTTPRQEDDIPVFKSGWFNGKTTGSPLLISFDNNNTRRVTTKNKKQFHVPGMLIL
jgi:chorismate synthase